MGDAARNSRDLPGEIEALRGELARMRREAAALEMRRRPRRFRGVAEARGRIVIMGAPTAALDRVAGILREEYDVIVPESAASVVRHK